MSTEHHGELEVLLFHSDAERREVAQECATFGGAVFGRSAFRWSL